MSVRSTEPVRVAAMAIAMVVSVGAFAAPRGFIGDTGGGGVEILGSNVDISNLSSKEYFRATNSANAIVGICHVSSIAAAILRKSMIYV